ncbi:hypothetical protein BESB_062820 [Besnoitia besnoiti]|uniref:Uncharacterized protein n=1 Tax=Besnoitia besnoiti TaxID=94643 RepID=A0A2A9MBP6_BESBE|nr:hypothetical protein BESB_062820 [Besnoitia besnoiti]PFH35395.1 hypothetical protein BESB_062820 [Besnoitia besnoiti]
MDIKQEFADGDIPEEVLKGCLGSDLQLLNGNWTILSDRSGPMTDITEMLGLDKLDRMSWELSLQLSAPRLNLSFTEEEEDRVPILRVDCMGQLGMEYIRDIRFDGQTKTGVHLRDLVPNPPLSHMSSGFDEGELLAVKDGAKLFVRYDMRKGTLYMTRVVLSKDPEGLVDGPVTLAKYCVVNKSTGVKHQVYRYHRRTGEQSASLCF